MQYEDFTLTPFDPARGILFKYGRMFRDRDRQVEEFERAIGAELPADFLELIGEYCEGGFDGFYRVYFQDGVEVGWTHLLLMKHPDEHDSRKHDTLQLLRVKAKVFFDEQGLAFLPFGEACIPSDVTRNEGYLAFDVRNAGAVVYVPESGGPRIVVATSFREMMVRSQFVFFG